MTRNEEKHCPVCLMQVSENAPSVDYQGMQFYFCTSQCHERFKANPHLYIGKPGKPSAKQRGECVIKQRVIKLQYPLPDGMAQKIVTALNAMMGIKQVSIEAQKIKINYDLLEVTAQQIENQIANAGENLTEQWVERLKRAFIHYLEETEIDNLEQNGSGGCHDHEQH